MLLDLTEKINSNTQRIMTRLQLQDSMMKKKTLKKTMETQTKNQEFSWLDVKQQFMNSVGQHSSFSWAIREAIGSTTARALKEDKY